MDRRHFLQIAAGIAAAAIAPEVVKAKQESCSICEKPIYAGEQVYKQGGPHSKCVNDRFPLFMSHNGHIFRLVNLKGNAKPGDLLYWTDLPNTCTAASLHGPGFIKPMAGFLYGTVNDTGLAWMQVR